VTEPSEEVVPPPEPDPLPEPEPEPLPEVLVLPSDFTVMANAGKCAEETPSLAVITMLEYVPTLLAEGTP
jgi:hypothetical protein